MVIFSLRKTSHFLLLICSILVFEPVQAYGEDAENSTPQSRAAPPPVQVVEPLEVWEMESLEQRQPAPPIPKPEEKADEKPEAKGLALEDFLANEEDGTGEGAEEDGSPTQATEDRVILSTKKQKRVEEARAYLRERGKAYQSFVAKARYTDPRGEPELKLCSVPTNDFGTLKQLKKIFPSRKSRGLKEKAKSIARAIRESGCDIVAFQGVAATDFAGAKEAIGKIAREIPTIPQIGWDIYVGSTNHKYSFSGFILRPGPSVHVLGIQSHLDKLLPRLEGFQEKKFLRTPFELNIRVAGKGGHEARNFSLVTFDLTGEFSKKGVPGELAKLQMADAMRQLPSFSSTKNDETRPITILVGERGEPQYSPSARVLRGRLRLRDFSGDGPCKLTEADVFRCEGNTPNPQILFGLISDGLQFPKRKKVNKVEKSDEQEQTEKKTLTFAEIKKLGTSDFYLFQNDLSVVWKYYEKPWEYNVGWKAVRGGLSNSPLIWAELNW